MTSAFCLLIFPFQTPVTICVLPGRLSRRRLMKNARRRRILFNYLSFRATKAGSILNVFARGVVCVQRVINNPYVENYQRIISWFRVAENEKKKNS